MLIPRKSIELFLSVVMSVCAGETEQNVSERFSSCLAKAQSGDPDAQHELGWRYRGGFGVKPDTELAEEWYAKAARAYRNKALAGIAEAQWRLGMCCIEATGVQQDYSQAVHWLTLSAKQGFALADEVLGNCYLNGNGVPRDLVRAVEHYRKAAEQNIGGAQEMHCKCIPLWLGWFVERRR
jgi:TPR repeat protein